MKKLLLSASLLAMSFSSAAFDFSESELQSYMSALPAVSSWADSQDSLEGFDLTSMLGGVASDTAQSSMISGAMSMLKEQELYQSFATLTSSYGFTPEQLLTVGTEVSMAYVENLKSGLSTENQETANTVMGGLSALKSKDTSSLMGAFGGSSSEEESVVSESNLELVNEYMPQLQKLFTML
ncbi:short-chain dehydrogenase [Pseudoalteromonas sp. MMG010]|uniref:short-chain dehydrogenase n=1 Tax=Pseudoalteromonas sp. MMG010 TaxID=2822685 RepID=UPI001B3A2D63|nr:short-chain dehydrogenase [Pseudoalteromonas sp. MMG010]MBQ4833647.1 short-chain dehydrogenase [Pseudoalteromonas sp. MMG010]